MIRVGIGGWDFDDWRKTFYPPGLKKADALKYASRVLTTIEINATFYKAQGAESFRRWREETPDNFVFAVKGHRAVCAAAKLASVGERIDLFFASGVLELGDKLGPILWQLPHNKRFDREDLSAFLKLLPREANGRRLMHAIEPRHESFVDPAFVELVGDARVPIVYADSDDYPDIADITGDFVYARLQRSSSDVSTGYAASELDAWSTRAQSWHGGGAPENLRYVGNASPTNRSREVFVYFIAGAKMLNPVAAVALIARLGESNQATGIKEIEMPVAKKAAPKKAASKGAAKSTARKAPAKKTTARTAAKPAAKTTAKKPAAKKPAAKKPAARAKKK